MSEAELHLDTTTVKSPVLYRAELPTPPDRIRKLPLHRGYPVPWFVAWDDAGVPDFRLMDGKKLVLAIKQHLCWICGEKMGSHSAFLVGPMCVVNRTSGEPPSHLTCAMYAAQACPWMARPHAKRRQGGLPEDAVANPAMLRRNPGVAVIYVTRGYQTFNDGNGNILFSMGPPSMIHCYTEARESTPAEVGASVRTGLPILQAAARAESPAAERELARAVTLAAQLLHLERGWEREPSEPLSGLEPNRQLENGI